MSWQMGYLRKFGYYLQLCRVSNLPTVVINTLAALVLSQVQVGWGRGVGLTVAMCAMYCGGMSLNDVLDVKEDTIMRPTRVLPSGKLSVVEAWAVAIGMFAVGIGLVAMQSLQGAVLTLGLALLIVAYDALHSKISMAIVLMGACRGAIYIIVAVSIAQHVNFAVAVGSFIQTVYVIAITLLARREKACQKPLIISMPWMIAGISLVDAALMISIGRLLWALVAITAFALVMVAQKWVRGD